MKFIVVMEVRIPLEMESLICLQAAQGIWLKHKKATRMRVVNISSSAYKFAAVENAINDVEQEEEKYRWC